MLVLFWGGLKAQGLGFGGNFRGLKVLGLWQLDLHLFVYAYTYMDVRELQEAVCLKNHL